MLIGSRLKHLLHCLTFVSLATSTISYLTLEEYRLDTEWQTKGFNPWQEYGVLGCCVLYAFRILVLLAIPQVILNVIGLFCLNAFDEKVTLKGSPLLTPVICIRTVTRGDYPELVRNNVITNLAKCSEVGMNNFLMEVVTDKPIGLPAISRIREIVVPTLYVPERGALYKARALQYCLQDQVDVLSDDDYIVHLDEETLLTTNSIRGILNFVLEKKYDFGQGLITYASDGVVNWITTLADSIRVADDMGKLRAQFYFFHKPILGWKGSFIVSRVGAEKHVTFDHGINGSMAEDCYFAMHAFMKGYTFNYIAGEMWEKSPFTISDFIQQRKRWVQGIALVVKAPDIGWKYKIWLSFSFYAWISLPFSISNIFLSCIFPLPMPVWVNVVSLFIGVVKIYMYVFGFIKSASLARLGLVTYALCFLCIIFVIVLVLSSVLEAIAVLAALFGDKHKFYVVNKDKKINYV